MKLHWMKWVGLKGFETYQRLESAHAHKVKRRLELARRRERIQRANCLKIFPELKGLP
jgi:hypothetical protein